jgi:hypothetical protein
MEFGEQFSEDELPKLLDEGMAALVAEYLGKRSEAF